jgi:hypothetical protein
MLDKIKYFKQIRHSPSCSIGTPKILRKRESSHLYAFKIDDSDGIYDPYGIAEHIGFKSNIINKVDYFLENELNILLIELKDLRDDIQSNNEKIAIVFEQIEQEDIKANYKRRRKKEVIAQVWKIRRDELIKKWNGSIAIIERLYRKTNVSVDDDPKYRLLIVCKNETDIRMLDALVNNLNGMMAETEKVQVCTTETLSQFLDSFHAWCEKNK